MFSIKRDDEENIFIAFLFSYKMDVCSIQKYVATFLRSIKNYKTVAGPHPKSG